MARGTEEEIEAQNRVIQELVAMLAAQSARERQTRRTIRELSNRFRESNDRLQARLDRLEAARRG